MLFSVTLLNGLLLLPAALAVPSGLGPRIARRREGYQSRISNPLAQDLGTVDATTKYSTNWAGAVWEEGNGTFTSVTGTFTVPIPSGSPGDSAAVWVGIDGDTCASALLQTGIDLTVSSDGSPTYAAWYEWLPAYATDFSGITISAGDVIKLTVTASSNTSGTATIENQTNGQNVSTELSSSASLCGQNAEWIVEDYTANGQQVPFANFGTVTFTNAQAGTYTPSGADIVELRNSSNVLTSVSTNGSSVTIQYV